MHIAFQIIMGLWIGLMMYVSAKLSFTRHGYINNQEFNVVLAILANKVIGIVGIVGMTIAAILLFR